MSTLKATDMLVEGDIPGTMRVVSNQALSNQINSSTGFSAATMPNKLAEVCRDKLHMRPRAWRRVNEDRSLGFDGRIIYPVYAVWNYSRREVVYNSDLV